MVSRASLRPQSLIQLATTSPTARSLDHLAEKGECQGTAAGLGHPGSAFKPQSPGGMAEGGRDSMKRKLRHQGDPGIQVSEGLLDGD